MSKTMGQRPTFRTISEADVHNFRVQGIAAGLAELHRLHGNEVEIQDTLNGFGLGLAELKAAGAEPFDLQTLSSFLKP
ncbi:hypothetical protein [Caulobacter sp. X]|uniref:hypothetical protein n=1 Tax=Caulobacter sp. X TaxID=2048901 RepID=UPI0011774FDD|nr:hypothetical protein [Caulobacter sp. X]